MRPAIFGTTPFNREEVNRPPLSVFIYEFQADAKKYPSLAAEIELKFLQGLNINKKTNTYIFYEKKKSYNDSLATAYFDHPNVYSMPDLGAVLRAVDKETEFILRNDDLRLLIMHLRIYQYDTKSYTPQKREVPFDFKIYILPGIRMLGNSSVQKVYFTVVYVADLREGIFTIPHEVYTITTSSFPPVKTVNKMIDKGTAWIQARLK